MKVKKKKKFKAFGWNRIRSGEVIRAGCAMLSMNTGSELINRKKKRRVFKIRAECNIWIKLKLKNFWENIGKSEFLEKLNPNIFVWQ